MPFVTFDDLRILLLCWFQRRLRVRSLKHRTAILTRFLLFYHSMLFQCD